MHAAAFANAALPAAARVLGLALRPYSLGHELWLSRHGNRALPTATSELSDRLADLPLAVLICSRTWTEFAHFDQTPWLAWRMFWWRRALRGLDYEDELVKFHEYVITGMNCFRVSAPQSNGIPGRTLGTPLLLILHQFVLGLPAHEIQLYGRTSWDYPYALAQMRYAAASEMAGHLEVENNAEREVRLAAEQWEMDHPESTLKFLNPEKA